MVALRRSLWALLAGVSRATVDFTNEIRAPASSQFVSWRTKFVDHVFSPFRITKKLRLNRHRNFNGYYAVGGRDKPVRCAFGASVLEATCGFWTRRCPRPSSQFGNKTYHSSLTEMPSGTRRNGIERAHSGLSGDTKEIIPGRCIPRPTCNLAGVKTKPAWV